MLRLLDYPEKVGAGYPPLLVKDPITLHQFKYGVSAWMQSNNQLIRFYGNANQPYQNKNLEAFRKALGDRPNMHILDVGANIGLMSIQFAKWSANVTAFEPTPKLAEMCAHNIKMNRLDHKVKIYENAVSNLDGNLTLRDQFDNGYVNLIVKPNSKINSRSVQLTVAAVKLDSCNLSKVDGIKIDVEGHEPKVIEGARDLIIRDRPVVMAEILPSGIKGRGRWFDPHEIHKWFFANGYRAYTNRLTPYTVWQYVRHGSDRVFVPEESDPLHNPLFT